MVQQKTLLLLIFISLGNVSHSQVEYPCYQINPYIQDILVLYEFDELRTNQDDTLYAMMQIALGYKYMRTNMQYASAIESLNPVILFLSREHEGGINEIHLLVSAYFYRGYSYLALQDYTSFSSDIITAGVYINTYSEDFLEWSKPVYATLLGHYYVMMGHYYYVEKDYDKAEEYWYES